MLRPKATLLLALALLVALGLSAHPAQAARTTSVTSVLSGGIICTTYATVVTYGVYPSGNMTLHKVSCSQPVGRLLVRGSQYRTRVLPSYTTSAVCYNTASCSVTLEVLQFGQGTWTVSTAAQAGTLLNPTFYGTPATAYNTIVCNETYCTE
ncbi:MAG: hypothetical protein OHK0022_39200 [Roseiflexaceae bacterium]